MSDSREQVAKQCMAVAHMARVLVEIHEELEGVVEFQTDKAVDDLGRRTAGRLEILGDMLNGMDAVTSEDAWVSPIVLEAQRRWPL